MNGNNQPYWVQLLVPDVTQKTTLLDSVLIIVYPTAVLVVCYSARAHTVPDTHIVKLTMVSSPLEGVYMSLGTQAGVNWLARPRNIGWEIFL